MDKKFKKIAKKQSLIIGLIVGAALALTFGLTITKAGSSFSELSDFYKSIGGDKDIYMASLDFVKGVGNVLGGTATDGYTNFDGKGVNIWGNLIVDGTTTLTGATSFTGTPTFPTATIQNGLYTYVSSGTAADATTTLACVANPFAATSTVDMAELLVTGISTTTIAVNVGTTTATAITGLTTSTLASNGLNILTIPTITGTTTGVAINLINYSASGVYAAGTVARMSVAPTEYVCFVAGEGSGGSTAGVTNTANTFAATYRLRWIK